MAPQPMAPQSPKEQKRNSYYAVGIATREPVRATLASKSLPPFYTNHCHHPHTIHCQPLIRLTASLLYTNYCYPPIQITASTRSLPYNSLPASHTIHCQPAIHTSLPPPRIQSTASLPYTSHTNHFQPPMQTTATTLPDKSLTPSHTNAGAGD